MSESRTRSAAEQTDALFDRYTLPKVALAVILAASLAGTWVTTRLHAAGGPGVVLLKWAFLVALGVLTGGFVWKHLFVRPGDLDDDAGGYCAEMYDRFDRIAAAAIVVLAVGSVGIVGQYVGRLGPSPAVVGYALLIAGLLVLAAATTVRSESVEGQFRSPVGLAALALALVVVVATATAEVAMGGFAVGAAGVRVLHLLAFAVWIGGAVWNIFVAVPTGQQRPTLGVVRAAGQQLERFRWAVRFIIPTLFLTGLYQAGDSLGTQIGPYLASPIGWAVVAKVGSIGLLVGIFKLCPMWRACSPIEGVCDLADRREGEAGEPASPDGTDPEVAGDD